jgi:hypothetical protein
MMETLPVCLFCAWHILVLGCGVWIGLSRPWRWRIVREGIQPASHATTPTNTRPYYEEDEVFTRR